MNDMTLALAVGLDNPSNWNTGCVAWVESRESQCGKDRKHGYLCQRHYGIAYKRTETRAQKEADARDRKAALRAVNLPKWKAELAKVEAEMDRIDPPRGDLDRAAYTGYVHPSIDKRRRMTDAKVQKMGALVSRHQELSRLIGND